MSLLLTRCRNPQLAYVRNRILNVLPAASFQMQKLLGLLDIEFSESVPTAAIECNSTPRLLLNPDFLAKHCQGDGDLFLLVMHELHHVILGHTRLFPRLTHLDNIVFDVVINAMLCRQFHATAGVGLFTNFYDWSKFPERLLRPPPGWPHADRKTALAGLSKKEARVFEALYYSDGSDITYFDLYRLLLKHCKVVLVAGDGDFEEVPLLGSHGEADDTGHPMVQEILRDIVGGWPPPPVRISGRDEGTTPKCWLFPEERDAGGIYRSALRSLLVRCGILSGSGRAPLKLEREPVVTVAETFLPQARDRRAPALRRTLGVAPLLYRTVNTVIRPRPKPVPVTHVYLDISGSMDSALPFITHALKRPLRDGYVRLFGFSTIVSEIPFRQLAGNLVDNTRGTDINAVLEHLAGLAPKACPRRVLLLTDGYVGRPSRQHLRQLRHLQFDTGLTGSQTFPRDLQDWTRITALPSLASQP
ncbi:MAG: VWA domain-containing protein [Terrimicrobiaceae bacterium]